MLFRFAQLGIGLGFLVALSAIFWREFGPATLFWGVSMIATGAFACWGLRKVRR